MGSKSHRTPIGSDGAGTRRIMFKTTALNPPETPYNNHKHYFCISFASAPSPQGRLLSEYSRPGPPPPPLPGISCSGSAPARRSKRTRSKSPRWASRTWIGDGLGDDFMNLGSQLTVKIPGHWKFCNLCFSDVLSRSDGHQDFRFHQASMEVSIRNTVELPGEHQNEMKRHEKDSFQSASHLIPFPPPPFQKKT